MYFFKHSTLYVLSDLFAGAIPVSDGAALMPYE